MVGIEWRCLSAAVAAVCCLCSCLSGCCPGCGFVVFVVAECCESQPVTENRYVSFVSFARARRSEKEGVDESIFKLTTIHK